MRGENGVIPAAASATYRLSSFYLRQTVNREVERLPATRSGEKGRRSRAEKTTEGWLFRRRLNEIDAKGGVTFVVGFRPLPGDRRPMWADGEVQRGRLIRSITSARLLGSSRKEPRTAEVRHRLPGLRMPRMVMQE